MSIVPGTREVSAEEFAAHAMEYLDEVQRTGEELRIVRNGTSWELRPPEPTEDFGHSSLRGTAIQLCTDDELVHFDTSDEWDALR